LSSDDCRNENLGWALDALDCARHFIKEALTPQERNRYLRRLKSLHHDLGLELKKSGKKKK